MRRIPLFVILVAIILTAGCTKEAPQTGSLVVTSVPRHAEVILDGTLRGRTPLVLTNLSAGYHLVEIRLPGYGEDVHPITVNPGNITFISAEYPPLLTPTPLPPTTPPTYETTPTLTMKPTGLPETPLPPGALYITSFPQGATIYLDGKGYGVTPNLIQNLTPKSYELRLSLVGWKDYKIVLSVSPGQTSTEEATLHP